MRIRLFDDSQFLGHAGKRAVGTIILVAKRAFKARAETALGFLHLRGDRLVKLPGLRGKLRKLSFQFGKRLAITPRVPLAQQHESKNCNHSKSKEYDHRVERHGQ